MGINSDRSLFADRLRIRYAISSHHSAELPVFATASLAIGQRRSAPFLGHSTTGALHVSQARVYESRVP